MWEEVHILKILQNRDLNYFIKLYQEIVKNENKTKEWRTKTAFRLFPEIKKNKIFIQKPPSIAVIL